MTAVVDIGHEPITESLPSELLHDFTQACTELAEARQHLAEVLRLDPTHTAARRLLESLGQ